MKRQLFRETLIVSSITLLSRLLGFVRDLLIARFFGVTLATDAFFVAFKLPNFFRRLFAEGALAHVFIPVLANYHYQNDRAAEKELIATITGNLALSLLLFTLIGIGIAPLLISLLAPGFAWHGTQYELAVLLLRICFPYLAFITLVAFAGGILNAYSKFAITAITPVLLNITLIIATLWFAPLLTEPIIALAWAVFIAGLLQVTLQLPALMRLGLLIKPRLNFQHSAVKQLTRRVLPAIFSVSVTQINLLLDTLIASFLTAGSVSWLYYSDRLVEFPVGILGLALGTVILPKLATAHGMNDTQAFSNTIDWGLRLAILIGTPATIGLILLAEPLLTTLFQYHKFTIHDVQLSAQSLRAYSIGLLSYIIIRVLVSAFSARQAMHTPVRYGIYAMLSSLVLNVLAIPLAHAGLALATSLGASINALLLLSDLIKNKHYQVVQGWGVFILRILLANSVLFALLYQAVDVTLWYSWHSAQRILHLMQWLIISITVYGGTLLLTGLKLKQFLNH